MNRSLRSHVNVTVSIILIVALSFSCLQRHKDRNQEQSLNKEQQPETGINNISKLYIFHSNSESKLELAESDIPVEAVIGGIAALLVLGGTAAAFMSKSNIAEDVVPPKRTKNLEFEQNNSMNRGTTSPQKTESLEFEQTNSMKRGTTSPKKTESLEFEQTNSMTRGTTSPQKTESLEFEQTNSMTRGTTSPKKTKKIESPTTIARKIVTPIVDSSSPVTKSPTLTEFKFPKSELGLDQSGDLTVKIVKTSDEIDSYPAFVAYKGNNLTFKNLFEEGDFEISMVKNREGMYVYRDGHQIYKVSKKPIPMKPEEIRLNFTNHIHEIRDIPTIPHHRDGFFRITLKEKMDVFVAKTKLYNNQEVVFIQDHTRWYSETRGTGRSISINRTTGEIWINDTNKNIKLGPEELEIVEEVNRAFKSKELKSSKYVKPEFIPFNKFKKKTQTSLPAKKRIDIGNDAIEVVYKDKTKAKVTQIRVERAGRKRLSYVLKKEPSGRYIIVAGGHGDDQIVGTFTSLSTAKKEFLKKSEKSWGYGGNQEFSIMKNDLLSQLAAFTD